MKYIFFMFIAISYSSCNNFPQTTSCNKIFTFDFPLKVEGLRDTINLSDTIFYQLTIPNQAKEINSSELLDITSAELNNFVISIKNLDTVRNDTEQLFQYIPEIGQSILSTNGIFSTINLEFGIDDIGRKVRFGISPQETGVYFLSTGALLNENESGPVVVEDDICITKTNDLIFTLENATNINNFYLLENSLITEYTDAPESELVKDGSFAFVVVE